jgi:hypothetical protein
MAHAVEVAVLIVKVVTTMQPVQEVRFRTYMYDFQWRIWFRP